MSAPANAAALSGLRGRWLFLARLAWIATALLVLGLELASIRALFSLLDARFSQSLSGAGMSPALLAALVVVANLAVVLAHLGVACLVFLRRPRDPVALLVALMLVTNGALLPLVFAFESVMLTPPWRLALDLVVFLGLVSSVATLYLFPDGRFAPRWTPALLALWTVGALLAIFLPALAISPASWPLPIQLLLLLCWVGAGLYAQFYRFRRAASPVEQQQIKWAGLGLLVAALTPLIYFLPLVILPAVDVSGLPNLLINRLGPGLFAVPAVAGVLALLALRLLALLFPVSFGVAILRYRLWDIDLVINRTLVYGSLTAAILAIYALIVGGSALILKTQASAAMAMAATVVVALLALPLRQRVQRRVNRLMYGERDDPWAVLSRLGVTLESAGQPEELLANLARGVAESLRLPYVAISVVEEGGSRVVAEYPPSAPAPLPQGEGSRPSPLPSPQPSPKGRGSAGLLSPQGRGSAGLLSPQGRGSAGLLSPHGRGSAGLPSPQGRGSAGLPSPFGRGVGGEGETLALVYQGQIIGHLLAAYRAPGEPFSPADRRLLAGLAHQAGPAVHAARLAADLQASRQRLVTAREEERRRLRRDLHDGLGPQLASLSLTVDAARNRLTTNPAEADRLLSESKAQMQEAISDVRRLVYGLRPPALDQLGLVGALHERAAVLAAGEGVQVLVQAPDSLPALPAAVEVAAYRIVAEALTNVARHAQARRATVWLCLDDALYLAVDDDGLGLPEAVCAGVGLSSMRERAEELSGDFRIEPRAEGGTRVAVRLPIT